MKKFKSAVVLALTTMLVATGIPFGGFATHASAAELSYKSDIYSDATLNSYKQYETVWTDKTHVKGDVKITVYFDKQNATQTRDVIFYVINWNGERIGTEGDISIITDYIKAGPAIESGNRAAVIVADFGGNPNSSAGTIEKSLALLRADLVGSKKLTVWKDPSASTKSVTTVAVHSGYVYFLPSGYRVERDILYFESDKHGALGTLDRVMKAWNEYIAGKKKIYYAYHTGTTACKCGHAADAECIAGAPQIDQNGKVVPHSEQLAPTVSRVEDCRKQDGSPMSYQNRLDIIYPSGAKTKTPVYSMAATHSPRTNNVGNTESRAHLVGFTFSGYTTAVFDYVYVPMARDDHYFYIAPYGTHGQNAAKSSRAAMRCIRYYAEEFGYSSELIGVAGISKGTPAAAVLSTVNNKDVKENSTFTVTVGGKKVVNDDLYFEGDVIDEKGNVLQATVQPYLTYEQGYDGTYRSTDREISSEVMVAYCAAGDGINWVYKDANPTIQLGGKRADGTTTTHVPMVLSCGQSDQYGCWDHWDNIQERFKEYATNPFLNISMEDQGHTYPFTIDPLRNYDRYLAYLNFFHRYLKPDDYNPAAAWIFPVDGEEEVSVNAGVEVKFTAAMDVESVKNNVKVVNAKTGEAVSGTWTATDLDTRFLFTHTGLEAGCEYRIEIAKTTKDNKGTAFAEAVTKTFKTEGSVALRPFADTYVSAAEPDAVFGEQSTMIAGNKGDAQKIAFASFSAKALRNASNVTLHLVASKKQSVKIYAIDGYKVNEKTLCYSNMPNIEEKAVLLGTYSLDEGENEIKMYELAEIAKHSNVTLVLTGAGSGTLEGSFATREDAHALQMTLVAETVGEGEAIADTYVSSANPDQVFGKADVLKLENVGGVENIMFVSYLQSCINKATSIDLVIPTGGDEQKVSVYLLDGYAVDEETLCYSNMPDFEATGTLVGEYTIGADAKLDVTKLAELVKQSRFTLVFRTEKIIAHAYSLDFEEYATGDILASYNSANSTEPNNNNVYSTKYLFREGGAIPSFKVADSPDGSGLKVATCTATQTYNRMRFYNTLSRAELTEADVGRRFNISICVRAGEEAKLSYGMMNGNGDYASKFYTAAGSKTVTLKKDEWQEISYDVTLTADMVKQQIGLFTVQLGTKGAQYYFDDFKVSELDETGAVLPTPVLTVASLENDSKTSIKLDAEGVVVEIPEDEPDETEPEETLPDETEPDETDPDEPDTPKSTSAGLIAGIVAAGVAAVGAIVAIVLKKKKK